ncbi:hypothetical protein [Paenibacillus sp. URB8-2]|uniref:hypothetical protein n=1 Tax=Paenibacillus sp. URB8-2 TaxID=2741301 RepID=UPI0015C25425|nr:hypothetical protein [Paenibacillus sp. URB8-2]BCG58826.1 hypothetical protein PUR_22510 [Paenibacillus sp. URB8-2]
MKVSFKKLEDMTADELKWIRNDELSQLSPSLRSHIRLRNPSAIERLIFEIIREFEMKLPYYEVNINGMLLQLLTCIPAKL